MPYSETRAVVRVRVRPDVVRVRARKTAPRTVVRVAAPHPQLISLYAHLMESEDFFRCQNPTALEAVDFIPSTLPLQCQITLIRMLINNFNYLFVCVMGCSINF